MSENIFEDIIAENFPNFGKETDIQFQENMEVRGWDPVTVLDVRVNYTNGSLMEERMYIIKISGGKFFSSIRKKKCKDYKSSGLNFKVVRVADT